MTTMIERVARAIAQYQYGAEGSWEGRVPLAIAAITAMREPTAGMTAVGIKRSVAWEYGDMGNGDDYPFISEQAIYTAMIDAALEETQ